MAYEAGTVALLNDNECKFIRLGQTPDLVFLFRIPGLRLGWDSRKCGLMTILSACSNHQRLSLK